MVLCGNKLDLDRYILIVILRQVPKNDAEKLANREGLVFFEVSAKTSLNLNKMFYSSIAELPYFEQYEIISKQKLIEELGKRNLYN